VGTDKLISSSSCFNTSNELGLSPCPLRLKAPLRIELGYLISSSDMERMRKRTNLDPSSLEHVQQGMAIPEQLPFCPYLTR
jgi:hypothetical protein